MKYHTDIALKPCNISLTGILTIQMLEVFSIPKARKERLVHFVEVSILDIVSFVK